VSVKSIDDAIEYVNDGEKPLAIYFFSKDKQRVNDILQHTSSGGVTVNDCVLHMACE
jgi:acyl-CoA reductase-like NAD-dependent aldehyde dehydrogenase